MALTIVRSNIKLKLNDQGDLVGGFIEYTKKDNLQENCRVILDDADINAMNDNVTFGQMKTYCLNKVKTLEGIS